MSFRKKFGSFTIYLSPSSECDPFLSSWHIEHVSNKRPAEWARGKRESLRADLFGEENGKQEVEYESAWDGREEYGTGNLREGGRHQPRGLKRRASGLIYMCSSRTMRSQRIGNHMRSPSCQSYYSNQDLLVTKLIL